MMVTLEGGVSGSAAIQLRAQDRPNAGDIATGRVLRIGICPPRHPGELFFG